MDRIANAFARGALEGALVVLVAALLCGLFGRDVDGWLRGMRRTPPPPPALQAPARRAAAPAPARRAGRPVPDGDEGVRQAARWARCSGPACYQGYDGPEIVYR